MLQTFEEVHLLFAMVTVGWHGKGGIYVVWNLSKAHSNVSGIVLIQYAIIKPPVLISLL